MKKKISKRHLLNLGCILTWGWLGVMDLREHHYVGAVLSAVIVLWYVLEVLFEPPAPPAPNP